MIKEVESLTKDHASLILALNQASHQQRHLNLEVMNLVNKNEYC